MEASNKLIARHPIDNWELTINPEFGCWVFSDDEWELGVGNVITVNSALYPNHKDAVKEAKKIAKKGRDTYLKNFNSTIVSDFILSKLFDYKSKNRFIWENN